MAGARDRIGAILRQTRIFNEWRELLIERLLDGATLHRCADGETIIHSGELSPNLAMVVTGSFVIRRPVHNANPMIVDYMMPGSATSYVAVLDGLPAVFDIVSIGESEIALITREALFAAIALEPARIYDIVDMLCRRLRIEYESIAMRTTNSLRLQLAKVMLYWARAEEVRAEGVVIPVGITQENIADMLGKSRTTISKHIGEFIDERILARNYGQIHILDVHKLMAIVAEEDPASLKLTVPLGAGKPPTALGTAD